MIQNEEFMPLQAIKHEVLLEAKNDQQKTFKDIATAKKMAEGTVKNIINGTTENPQILSLAPICEELNVPIEKVLYGYEEKRPAKTKETSSVDSIIEFLKSQIESMEESNKRQLAEQKALYEQIIKELKEERQKFENHFEKRLADKREHIDTILLDKKWFRLASVFSVLALLGVFLFIEFMTPGHGWFVFGN